MLQILWLVITQDLYLTISATVDFVIMIDCSMHAFCLDSAKSDDIHSSEMEHMINTSSERKPKYIIEIETISYDTEKQQDVNCERKRKIRKDATHDTLKNVHAISCTKCQYCQKVFKTSTSAKKHERSRACKQFKCHKCSMIFPQRKTLILHNRQAHKKYGDTSGRMFLNPLKKKDQTNGSQSTLMLNETTYFKCFKCSLNFSSFTDFMDHKRRGIHFRNQARYKCQYCDKCCKFEHTLQMHQRIHKDLKTE